jgi:protein CpxP
MKITKSLIIAALVAGNLVAWDVARAQDTKTNTPPPMGQPGGPGGRGMRPPTIEQISEQLALTEDQKPKVKVALDDQQKKMKDLRADTSLSQEDRRTKMKTIRDDSTAKMKEILTPEQFTKYQKMMPAGRNRPGGAGAPPAPTTPPPAGN